MMHSEENTVYSELQAAEVLETITVLERRISERFPASGLRRVSVELHRQASAVETVVVRLRRPLWPLRIGAGLGILGIVGTTSGFAVLAWHTSLHVPGVSDLLQATEAAFNVIILLAMAMFFCIRWRHGSSAGRYSRRCTGCAASFTSLTCTS